MGFDGAGKENNKRTDGEVSRDDFGPHWLAVSGVWNTLAPNAKWPMLTSMRKVHKLGSI